MSRDSYARALHAAVREYEKALANRAALDTRIAHLQQTIGTLNKLCGYEPTVPMGLTEACRMVLRSSGRSLTAVDVRERLRAFGFDLEKYVNALAAIHTVLKRMTDSGELAPADADEHNDAAFERAAYDYLGPGLIASRTGRRLAGAPWLTGVRKPTGVGLCPPKDRPKLARATKKSRSAPRTR
jgi:hypothetical protein